MPTPAYPSTIKISGTQVSYGAGEACTALVVGSVYQITNAARRLVDPSFTPTIKDNGVTVPSTQWTVDYLLGKVTFSGYTATGPVTVVGYYLPTQAILEVTGFSLSVKQTLVDSTTHDSGGAVQKTATLSDFSGSISFNSLATADLDSVATDTQSLDSFLTNATPKLLEWKLGGSAVYFRAWVLLEGVETKSEVAGLVQGTANFQASPQRQGAGFSIA